MSARCEECNRSDGRMTVGCEECEARVLAIARLRARDAAEAAEKVA